VDQEALSSNTYKEVISHKNFYFGIDENKKHTNTRVWNKRAPGNPTLKPQVILPHEHVHVDHYWNANLTEE